MLTEAAERFRYANMPRLLIVVLALQLLLGPLWAAPPAGSDEGVKVDPLPEPPAIEAQVRKSDLIVRAVLLHTRTYRIGTKVRHQARFRVIGSLKKSVFYPLSAGEEFSVLYGIKAGVYGPHFMEAPEPGEYVVLLELRNVTLGGRIVGQDVLFVYPNPFALYEPLPDVLQAVGAPQ